MHGVRFTYASAVAMTIAIGSSLAAQADMAPINDAPNPYRTIEGWAKMPPGRTWGSTSAVAIDNDGSSIWVAERCSTNVCVGSSLDPVMHFDANGNLLSHFGAGMILSPHGILVDKESNIWVIDCTCTVNRGDTAATKGKGHQIFKFSPTGKLLMTLGEPGGGRGEKYFWQPNAMLIAPNGTIYVAEGHSSAAGSTARVYKFAKDGKLIKTWGQLGAGPDDFDQPHALAMDSKGRLYVGDRGNNRIKIFDENEKLLDTWYQWSRPSGIFIDKSDNIYVADSESQSVGSGRSRAWKRGIRIGSVKDGKVIAFIPDPVDRATNTSSAEGVAVDKNGVIYGAEVGGQRLQRYVKKN